MPGSAFSGSLDGHLRAYSTIDGKILWDYDTAKEFQTKNGVKASGGPLDHGGATIVNGDRVRQLRQYPARLLSRRKIGRHMESLKRLKLFGLILFCGLNGAATLAAAPRAADTDRRRPSKIRW